MSADFAVILRGGQVVTPAGIQMSDLAFAEGRIARLGPNLAGSADEEVDVSGQWVFPGIIDAHVHFNEPGRTEWEGLSSGSAALAAGGGTTFFDMPLNSEPPVLDSAAFREKRRLAEEKSCLDFGLWGGLTPRNLDQLAALRDAGAMGVKAFMSNSGIESFPRVDAATLREGMKRAARLGLLVAVHAEDETLAVRHTERQRALGRSDADAWLASRPVEVECAAIRLATELAGETGCALHVVHVSSPDGLALITAAREQRVDVTAEVCPHYLLLNAADVARIGAPAKCAPPIRDEACRRGLWAALRRGEVHTIGSDHSPAPAEMKTSPDFFAIWGGIAGVQSGARLLLSAALAEGPGELPRFAELMAGRVARRFRLGRKGTLAEGMDADVCVLAPTAPETITADELWTRHRISPYVGREARLRIVHTYRRGHPVFADGRLTNFGPPARFLRPDA